MTQLVVLPLIIEELGRKMTVHHNDVAYPVSNPVVTYGIQTEPGDLKGTAGIQEVTISQEDYEIHIEGDTARILITHAQAKEARKHVPDEEIEAFNAAIDWVITNCALDWKERQAWQKLTRTKKKEGATPVLPPKVEAVAKEFGPLAIEPMVRAAHFDEFAQAFCYAAERFRLDVVTPEAYLDKMARSEFFMCRIDGEPRGVLRFELDALPVEWYRKNWGLLPHTPISAMFLFDVAAHSATKEDFPGLTTYLLKEGLRQVHDRKQDALGKNAVVELITEDRRIIEKMALEAGFEQVCPGHFGKHMRLPKGKWLLPAGQFKKRLAIRR